MQTLSVIGLGKLGTPMLAVFAGAGYRVIGMDSDPTKVVAINEGHVPEGIVEPDVQPILDEKRGAYSATSSIDEAVRRSEATFVIVPTPSGPDGGFTLEYLTPVCERIAHTLANKTAYHLVVITSTVMPGQTAELAALLEQVSGKTCGVDFGLVYSPEFIALGNVVNGLRCPDYVLIGHNDDPQALEQIMSIYRKTAPDVSQVATAWVNAEIAKIAQNAFITMKITFANQLGNLCQAVPGANVDDVTFALGHDQRVGARYLRAGTAYGGPCFPRDNRALVRAGINHHADFGDLATTVNRLNEWATDDIPSRLYGLCPIGTETIGVLGLAYKPGTPVIEESASIDLVQTLVGDYPVIVYDPLAMNEARAVFDDGVQYADSVADLFTRADVIVLMHPDPNLLTATLSEEEIGKVVIDPWRQMSPEVASYFAYYPLGVGPTEKEKVR